MISTCMRGWVEKEMGLTDEFLSFSLKASRELERRLHENTTLKKNFFKGILRLCMLGFQGEEELAAVKRSGQLRSL